MWTGLGFIHYRRLQSARYNSTGCNRLWALGHDTQKPKFCRQFYKSFKGEDRWNSLSEQTNRDFANKR